MALPPTIPTSFVPRQPVSTTARKRVSGANPFLMLSYIILGIALLGCAGVYGYKYYLDTEATKKAKELQAAQDSIDQATVSQFIHLRDRFTSAQEILNKHVVLSQFFDLLEKLTLQGVRFNSLDIAVADDRTAQVSLNGSAKSFNALAAQSSAFAAEKNIKRAIFSGINVNGKDGNVTFQLRAELDPSLVTSKGVPQAQQVVVPITPATTTPVAPVLPVQNQGTSSSATTTKP